MKAKELEIGMVLCHKDTREIWIVDWIPNKNVMQLKYYKDGMMRLTSPISLIKKYFLFLPYLKYVTGKLEEIRGIKPNGEEIE